MACFRVRIRLLSFAVLLLALKRRERGIGSTDAFSTSRQGSSFRNFRPVQSSTSPDDDDIEAKRSDWSVSDDWSKLSRASPHNAEWNSDDVYNQDVTEIAAMRMQLHQQQNERHTYETETDEDDVWLRQQLDSILTQPDDLALDGLDNVKNEHSLNNATDKHLDFNEDDMGDELSLLIRCNESPQNLLIQTGRTLPTLSQIQKDALSQLLKRHEIGDDDRVQDSTAVTVGATCWKPTKFLRQACQTMLKRHGSQLTEETKTNPMDTDSTSKANTTPSSWILNRQGIAQWLETSLGQPKGTIGVHDLRINQILSYHAKYASGYLTMDDFVRLYVKALVGKETKVAESSLEQLERFRIKEIRDVWRDIRNHGILSPVETERRKQQAALDRAFAEQSGKEADTTEIVTAGMYDSSMILDECEIVDDSSLVPSIRGTRKTESSYQKVELAADNKTPIWMKDGEFVFIDEQSCIGCTQCALAAPGSFHMTEYDGRARTFQQRNGPDVAAAVKACPVDCMHYVSYRELKELEDARDRGDGREDHRHFGQTKDRGYIGHTPLHVSRRGSDSNHRSSWYQ